MDYPRGDRISRIVAFRLHLSSQSQSTLHCFEEFTNSAAISRNFHLHSSIAIEIDDREGLAAAREDILSDIKGTSVPFCAERAAKFMSFVGMCAGGAVRGVAGEGAHDVEFIVVGEARVCRGNGGEAHLFGGGRHGCG